MTTALRRGLALLEQLATHPEGLPLGQLAELADAPKSACPRLLAELKVGGYVKQVRSEGGYVLTTKVASLGLRFLSGSGIVDIAQPLIERLAEVSGELARLSLVDDDRLTWVVKFEGGRKGFRYDPDMGMDARLSCTSSGHAWLQTLSDERAVALVSKQGFGLPKDYGPNAPTTIKALLLIFSKFMTTVALPMRYVCRLVPGEYGHGAKAVERGSKETAEGRADASGRQRLRRSGAGRGRGTPDRVHMEGAAR